MFIERSAREKQYIKRIGKNIRNLRLKKGVTLVSLSQEIGYKKDESLSDLESGKALCVDVIILSRIAKVLNTEVVEFLK